MGTRERLLENGAALFAAKGFHGVGVEELGDSVGLTGPSLYRHFRTKSALL
jgi:AcrR family transcriptional regulator